VFVVDFQSHHEVATLQHGIVQSSTLSRRYTTFIFGMGNGYEGYSQGLHLLVVPECFYQPWVSSSIQWPGFIDNNETEFPHYVMSVQTRAKISYGIWATTEMESFRTLKEMTSYSDFPSSIKKIVRYWWYGGHFWS